MHVPTTTIVYFCVTLCRLLLVRKLFSECQFLVVPFCPNFQLSTIGVDNKHWMNWTELTACMHFIKCTYCLKDILFRTICLRLTLSLKQEFTHSLYQIEMSRERGLFSPLSCTDFCLFPWLCINFVRKHKMWAQQQRPLNHPSLQQTNLLMFFSCSHGPEKGLRSACN